MTTTSCHIIASIMSSEDFSDTSDRSVSSREDLSERESEESREESEEDGVAVAQPPRAAPSATEHAVALTGRTALDELDQVRSHCTAEEIFPFLIRPPFPCTHRSHATPSHAILTIDSRVVGPIPSHTHLFTLTFHMHTLASCVQSNWQGESRQTAPQVQSPH